MYGAGQFCTANCRGGREMSQINMFPHVGSGNHGCEAIVRSTEILLADWKVNLFSNHPEEDKNYMPDSRVRIFKDSQEVHRFSGTYFKTQLQKRCLGIEDAFDRATFGPVLRACGKNQMLMSVGGDLYCYDTPDYIYRVNRYVREQGCKTVLWGCSVEPSYIDEQMKADLQQYDLICARESITYDTLKKINPNTILTVDPAFALPAEEVDIPAEHYIGVNISPMIQTRETVPGITMKNYVDMVRYILERTDETVALIPHVVWRSNDDREALKQLKAAFPDNDRVVMVKDHNAVQQKYIIAHCRMFVGARTHATIAAYSSCVPTLVVGYSVKAKGIAKDLFGRYEDYVLPVQSLKEPEDLTRAFCWLMEHEMETRAYLSEIMPEYARRTQVAVEAVNQLRAENT